MIFSLLLKNQKFATLPTIILVKDNNSCGSNLPIILSNLELDMENILWFKVFSLKANPGKSQFMILVSKVVVNMF